MAEVIQIPKVGPDRTSLTREHSSLDDKEVVKVEATPIEHKGTATVKKKTLGEKFKNVFIAADFQDVKNYVVWDIIVPSIRMALHDVMVGIADSVFLGAGTAASQYLNRNGGVTTLNQQKINYSKLSSSKAKSLTMTGGERRSLPASRPTGYEVLEMTFDDYGKLQEAWDLALDVIDTYGKIGIDRWAEILASKFKRQDGAPFPYPDYTAAYYGWKSLDGAAIVTVGPNSYYFKTPKPIPIKD